MDPPRTTRRFQNWCPLKPMWQAGSMAAFVLLPYTLTLRHSGPRADTSFATDEVNPGKGYSRQKGGDRLYVFPDLRLRGDDVLVRVAGYSEPPAFGLHRFKTSSAFICVRYPSHLRVSSLLPIVSPLSGNMF